GHGSSPVDGNEGYLVLKDGFLFARQIEEVAPAAKFVFLNACWSATAGRDWDIERRYRSVAEAFGRSDPGKGVIAPLWPVVNVQAAKMALDVIENTLNGVPLAEALHIGRENSLRRYDDGEPDISWMAYRYFGDPNKRLPGPMQEPMEDDPPSPMAPA